MILFKTKDLLEKDTTYTPKSHQRNISKIFFKLKKNQTSLLMAMQLMIKRSKMRKMEKMILFKMKVLPERDIIYMLNLILIVINMAITTSVRDILMNLQMVMPLMIKKS